MGNRGTRNRLNLNNNKLNDDNENGEENDINKQPEEEESGIDKYHTPYFKVPVEYPKEITKGNDQLSSNRYILYMIIEYLDIQSLCRFSQCCWYFKQIADQDKYWKALYFKHFQNSITVVPSLERWNFENSAKDYLKNKFVEDYEVYKKRILEYNEKMDLDLVRFELKHKVVRFPGKFVIKIIPKGRRWKYMLQIARKYKYIAQAYLETKPHDYVFIPAGRYNCNDWSSDYPSQWGGLKINNPVHFIGEEKSKGNVSVFIESTDNRPLEWNASGGSCSNIYFHQHQFKKQYYTHAVSIREGNVMFKNCRFTSDSITSVRLEKNTISKFIDCHFLKSNHAAISVEDCSTIIDSCWFYENNLTGIEIRKVPEDLVGSDTLTSSSGLQVPVIDKESKHNIIIQNCRIFNNEGGGIEITEEILPIVKNNHIYDNKEFGIEIRLGDGIIEGNTIKDNKTFGIIAWTTSQKKRRQFEDLLKKNRVIDNLLGDCSAKVIPPTQKTEENDQSFDYFITSALKDKICTFGFTGRHFHKQNWYRCITCNLVNNLGCCEICVKTCHEKCEVEFQGVSTAYCDCYFSGTCQYAPNQEREMKKITTGTPIIKRKENDNPQEKESEKNEEMNTSSESEDEEKEDNYLNQSQLLLKIQNAEDGDEDFLPF